MGDRDSNGVPFTVAPVRADDPKRKDEKDKKEGGEEQQQQNGLVDGKPAVNGKAGEEEELVSFYGASTTSHWESGKLMR
jgi:hypothetical protein